MISQPQGPIKRVDGGLQEVLRLIVRDVRDLDVATRRAQTSRMQLFDGAVRKGNPAQPAPSLLSRVPNRVLSS